MGGRSADKGGLAGGMTAIWRSAALLYGFGDADALIAGSEDVDVAGRATIYRAAIYFGWD